MVAERVPLLRFEKAIVQGYEPAGVVGSRAPVVRLRLAAAGASAGARPWWSCPSTRLCAGQAPATSKAMKVGYALLEYSLSQHL